MHSLERTAGCFLLMSFLGLHLFAQTISQPTIWATKPDVSAFEKMENDRLAAAQREVNTLVAVKGARSVENTLAPFDEAIRQINSAAYLAGLMQQVHPDATFRDHATALVTKASAAQTALALNHEVYNALAALDLSHADNATRYYVQRQLLEFRLAGVDKDEATRTRIRKLNDQASEQNSMFDRNISDDQKSVEADPSELDGFRKISSTTTSQDRTERFASARITPMLSRCSHSARAMPCAAGSISLTRPAPIQRTRKS